MDLEVLFMGLIQGMTEFLPVSSSGHLALAKAVMKVSDMSLSFDLVLHVSTLLAVMIYFAKDIAVLFVEWSYGIINKNARSWKGWRFGWAVVVGTLITAVIGLLLRSFEETVAGNLIWLGVNFWITGVILLSTRFLRLGWNSVRTRDGAIVGLAQGISVLPGISRSGTTIWAGMITGLSRDEAFRFSFLLSIPAILGATILEASHLGGSEAFFADLPDMWYLGAGVAFVSGMASLLVLKKLVLSEKWWLLAIYCLVLGTISVIFSIMGA